MTRVNYRSPAWRFHREVSFACWFALAGWVGYQAVAGLVRHTWPERTAVFVLVALALALHPPLEGHHWISYRRPSWLLAPLVVAWYVVGVMPVSPLVNWAEYRLRHLCRFRSEVPGTLLALGLLVALPAFAISRLVGP